MFTGSIYRNHKSKNKQVTAAEWQAVISFSLLYTFFYIYHCPSHSKNNGLGHWKWCLNEDVLGCFTEDSLLDWSNKLTPGGFQYDRPDRRSSGSSQSSQKFFKWSGRSYGNASQTIANDRDDWDDLDRLDRIEFYSGRSGSSQSSGPFAIVWVAFPCDRPDRLNIFWDDWDDPNDHMETRLKQAHSVQNRHAMTYCA